LHKTSKSKSPSYYRDKN